MAFNFGTLVQSYLENMPVIGTIIKATELGRIPANAVSDLMNGSPENNFALSLANKATQAGPTGLDVWQNNINRENYINRWKWDVEGMQNAGINPALLYGGSSSGGSAPQVSPSAGSGLADLLSVITIPAQLKRLNAETKNIEANTENTKTKTEETGVDIEFKKRTIDARAEGVNLQNNLTRADIVNLNKSLDVADAEIVKLYREADSFDSIIALNTARSILANAEAKKVSVLLPLEEAYMMAQTDKERELAGFYLVQTAYQQGLIDNGMLKAVCDKTKAEASIADLEAYLNNPEYDSSSGLHDSKPMRAFIGALHEIGRFLPLNSLAPHVSETHVFKH